MKGPKGNLVEEYMIGSTKIEIYDGAYAGKTQEDIDNILKRIANIAHRAVKKEKEA